MVTTGIKSEQHEISCTNIQTHAPHTQSHNDNDSKIVYDNNKKVKCVKMNIINVQIMCGNQVRRLKRIARAQKKQNLYALPNRAIAAKGAANSNNNKCHHRCNNEMFSNGFIIKGVFLLRNCACASGKAGEKKTPPLPPPSKQQPKIAVWSVFRV